ncbi:MAG: pyridoxal phosphate-dependent aminotransferase [Fervidicoccaceae archaeon]
MRIRLSLNESPFQPSPKAVELASKYAPLSNRYDVAELRESLISELSRYSKVESEMIEIYPGSSYCIVLFLIYAKITGLPLVVPFPTFHVLHQLANSYEIAVKAVELKGKEFILNSEELLKLSEGSIVYLSNPNNPTSDLLIEDEDLVSKIASKSKLVLLDEAYFEFSGKTFYNLAYEHDNLVVLRTLSKAFNIAGVRLGYSISSKKAKEIFNKLRVGYEIPIMSQAMALGALKDIDYMRKTVNSIILLRDETRKRLLELGIWSPRSRTNFLFLELPMKCVDVKREIERSNIEVLCLSDMLEFKGRFENWMRVSIGNEEHMNLFVEKIQQVLS